MLNFAFAEEAVLGHICCDNRILILNAKEMKKLLLILMFVAISQHSYSLTFQQTEDPEKEKIELLEEPNSEPNRDRSLIHIECFLNKLTNALEIEYYGLETPVVYVLDVNNNVIIFKSTEGMSGFININCPAEEGCYRLIIQSEGYYGEGVVIIHK